MRAPRMAARCKWNCCEKKLTQLYRRYGVFVAKNPLPFLLAPIFLTGLLSLGIFRLNVVRGVDYLFAARDAPYKREAQVLKEFWTDNDNRFYPGKDVVHSKGAFVLVMAKDGGSVLRPNHAKQMVHVMELIADRLYFVQNGSTIGYRTVCLQYRGSCYANNHASFISNIYANGDENHFNVTYPYFRSNQISEELYLGSSLGGVTLDSKSRVVAAQAWIVSYLLKTKPPEDSLSRRWELALAEAIDNDVFFSDADLLQLSYFHSQTFDLELLESGRRVLPKFLATFIILVVFSVACTCSCIRLDSWFTVDWVMSKPVLGLAGLGAAILGIMSAIGTMSIFGAEYADMVNVMPFLAVSIGIDDMFVILACWRATKSSESVENRLSQALSHAAVSITITSCTDALSFAIGALSPMPAVTIFCSYAAVAVLFTFLYTMTFLIAVMVYLARLEHASKHSVFGFLTVTPQKAAKKSPLVKAFAVGTEFEKISFKTDSRPWYKKFFEDIYAPFICKTVIRVIILVIFVAYLIGGIVGTTRVEVGFELKNVLLQDSPAMSFFENREKYFGVDGSRLDIIVGNAPNLGNKTERKIFVDILEQFENTLYSEGREYTQFWLFGYERYMSNLGFQLPDDANSFYTHLTSFILSDDFYSYDLVWNGTRLSTFRLSVGMANIVSNDDKIGAATTMRSVAAAYPQYNITVFTIMWPLADQFMLIIPQIIFNTSIAIASMILISLLLIPHPLCSVAIAATIISIDIGVIGYMTFWGVNLDCVSMITIAMSVGFSVDFAAHITYGYIAAVTQNKQNNPSPQDRVAASLGALGWPLLQGAMSTLFGMLILSTVKTYIVQTCFKTVVLVILFGTIHALLFLPVCLSVTHEAALWVLSLRKNAVQPAAIN